MLCAPIPPNGPRNRYVISCRRTLRSNGSDAIVVVTVASSSPDRRIDGAPRRLPLQDLGVDRGPQRHEPHHHLVADAEREPSIGHARPTRCACPSAGGSRGCWSPPRRARAARRSRRRTRRSSRDREAPAGPSLPPHECARARSARARRPPDRSRSRARARSSRPSPDRPSTWIDAGALHHGADHVARAPRRRMVHGERDRRVGPRPGERRACSAGSAA